MSAREQSGGDRLRRWSAAPLVLLVRVYQLFLSPLLPNSCRFYPSCSAYSLTALRRFGPVVGTWLTIRRLARCHPWNPGGVDHVPRRGADGRPIRRTQWQAPDNGTGQTRKNDHGNQHGNQHGNPHRGPAAGTRSAR